MAIVVLVVSFTCAAPAQTSRLSGITGKVSSSDGDPIPGASITVIHLPTADTLRTATRDDGTYTLMNLKIGGPYRVSVSHIGFAPQSREGLQLRASETVRLVFQLRERAFEGDEIVITGNRAEILSETTTGASVHVGRDQIDRLPLPVESLEAAAGLSPYIAGGSVLGRNPRYNDIQIDGVKYTDQFGMLRTQPLVAGISVSPISLEAIEEVQGNLSPFDVTRSGFTGGAFDAVTRSGTNVFQGSVYMDGVMGWAVGKNSEDGREDMSDLVNSRAGFQAGGQVGGTPVYYYVATELNRLDYPVDRVFDSKTAGATRFGIPSESLRKLRTQLDTAYNYDMGGADLVFLQRNAASFFGRLDARLSDNNRASVRYNFFRTEADRTPDIPGVYAGHTVSRGVSTTHWLSAELSSMFGNEIASQTLLTYTARDFSSAILGKPFPFVDISYGNASSQWTHFLFGSDGGAAGGWSREQVIGLQNTTSISLGMHTVTFGLQGDIHRFDAFQLEDQYGRYLYGSAAFSPRQRPREYQIRYVRPGVDDPGVEWRALQAGVYAQDEWIVSPTFRLSIGLRVDLPFFLDHPEENSMVRDIFKPLGYDLHTSRLPMTRPMLSPRVAFNADPKGDRTTQIRGGLGVLTGRVPFVWLSNQFANTGLKYVHIKENKVAPLFAGDPYNQPRPGQGNSLRETSEINITDRNFVFPQVVRGTIGMDFALPWNWVASLEVVFSHSINEVVYRNINLKQYGTLNPQMSEDARPTYGLYASKTPMDPTVGGYWNYSRNSDNFTNVILLSNTKGGSSNNNTIQLQRKPDNDGLFIDLGYTFGYAKDVNSGISDQAYAQWKDNPAYDPNEPAIDYSAFDREHRIVGAASYRYEWGTGWAATIGAVYTGMSGQPFSYVYDGDINGDGENYNDLFYVPAKSSEYFFVDVDGFMVALNDPAYAEMMNWIAKDPYLSSHRGKVVERNGARMPWSHLVDLRMALQFPVSRSHNLEVHCDIFNLMNLLNPANGIVWSTPANIIPVLQLYDIDKIGRPQFRWAAHGSTPLIPESLDSRWRLRVGMRYSF